MLKTHEVSFGISFGTSFGVSFRAIRPRVPGSAKSAPGGCRPPPENLQVIEKLYERPGNTNVMDITEARGAWRPFLSDGQGPPNR
jgi:hypothetical protein